MAQTAREMAVTGWPLSARKVNAPPVALTSIRGMVRLTPDLLAEPIAVNSWAVPLLNGEIRLQKPPLPYWCAAILFRLFGFSEAAARFTPALMGSLATIFVYDLTRMLLGRWKARLAALVWITTLFIPEEFRKAMADPYLAFFTLVCIWAWIKAAKIARDGRSAQNDPRSAPLCVVIFYVSLALGILAKGPPLFLHIGIALAAFHYCYRWPLPRGLGGHLIGLTALALIALPWPIYVIRHIPHAVDLWRYESVGELSDNVENARPLWFYAPNVVFIALPWAAAWIAGFIVPLRRARNSRVSRSSPLPWYSAGGSGSGPGPRLETAQTSKTQQDQESEGPASVLSLQGFPLRASTRGRRLFPMIWFAATVIFFSLVHLKKNPYLLPAAPAQTLLIVEGLAAALAVARRARGWTWGGGILAAQTAIGIAGCIFVLIALRVAAPPAYRHFAMTICALAVCCWTIVVLQLRNPMAWVWWQASGYLLLILGVMLTLETRIDNARSAKSLCAELALHAEAPDTAILRARLPEEVAVYLPLKEEPALARHVLVVVDDQFAARERVKTHVPPPIPSPEHFDSSFPDGRVLFVDRIPMKTAPGDARWKVYDLTVERLRYAAR